MLYGNFGTRQRAMTAALLLAATPAFAATTAGGHVHTAACEHYEIDAGTFAPRSIESQPVEQLSLTGGPAQLVTSPTFVIEDLGGVGVGTQARAGFEKAIQAYQAVFTDNITVRLALGFASLAPNVLAQAGSTVATVDYTTLKGAMAADRKSFTDSRAVAGLPVSKINFLSNEPGTCTAVPGSCGPIDATSRTLDADDTFDNNNIRANTTVIKALGLAGDIYARDAQITFSSNFLFDFDASDGIDADKFDFVAIAVHEIGHALGFRSGVDLVDNNAIPLGGATLPATPGGPTRPRSGLDGIAYATVLDLFRYQDGVLDWTVGGAPCFSLDTGATCGPLFSTGAFNGDRRQASHWKDNLGIGIMDPTFARGETGGIRRNDLRAFDVSGWDLVAAVPAPATLALFALGLGGLAALRRRAA